MYLNHRTSLKGTRIAIYEDLTPRNFDLLHEAKSCEKVQAAWSSDGRVFVLSSKRNGNTTKQMIQSKSDLLRI